jgi:gamma-glutamylcyclotransferase (GGCT)/AIG2-like uncharacterized protein YtfP
MSAAEKSNSAQLLMDSDCRLAVYGTLAPGCANHHELSDLSGLWIDGKVRGQLFPRGWGAEMGYPGIVLVPH